MNDEYKKADVIHTFRECKSNMVGLSETRLRGSGIFEWNWSEGEVIRLVRYYRRLCMKREEMMKDECSEKLVDCKCVSMRLLEVKFKYKRFRMIVMVTYALCNEREGEVKDTFWREFERALEDVLILIYKFEVKIYIVSDR